MAVGFDIDDTVSFFQPGLLARQTLDQKAKII